MTERIIEARLRPWGMTLEEAQAAGGGRVFFMREGDGRRPCPFCYSKLPREELLLPPTERVLGFAPSTLCPCERGVPGYLAVRCLRSQDNFGWSGCGNIVWVPVSEDYISAVWRTPSWVATLFYEIKRAA